MTKVRALFRNVTRVSKKYKPRGKKGSTKHIGVYVAGKLANRYAGSGSDTSTKRSSAVIRSPSTGMGHSKYVYRTKGTTKTSTIKLISEKTVDSAISGTTVLGLINQQGVGLTGPLWEGAAVIDQFNNACDVFTKTAGTGARIGIAINQNDFKVFCGSWSHMLSLTNASSETCCVEVYDLVSKVTNATMLDPETLWDNGLANTSGNSAVKTRLHPYEVPTSSPQFNNAWRILRKTKLEMGPGRSHEHEFVAILNRVYDTEKFQNFSMIKGVTCRTMFVVRGVAVDDQDTTDVPTSGIVNMSPSKIIYLINRNATIRVLPKNPRQRFVASYLATMAPNVPKAYNEGSGDITNMLFG